jgi:hypothetical protein
MQGALELFGGIQAFAESEDWKVLDRGSTGIFEVVGDGGRSASIVMRGIGMGIVPCLRRRIWNRISRIVMKACIARMKRVVMRLWMVRRNSKWSLRVRDFTVWTWLSGE